LGHHYAIWTSDSNFLLAQKKIFRHCDEYANHYTIDAVHMKEMCGINVPLIFLYKVYIFHVQDGHHITLALKKNEEYDEMLICLVDVKWLII
jgi:hypothetical protein